MEELRKLAPNVMQFLDTVGVLAGSDLDDEYNPADPLRLG
jgi:hypothetical protein